MFKLSEKYTRDGKKYFHLCETWNASMQKTVTTTIEPAFTRTHAFFSIFSSSLPPFILNSSKHLNFDLILSFHTRTIYMCFNGQISLRTYEMVIMFYFILFFG